MSETEGRPVGFEVEAGTMEQFFHLLERREDDRERGTLLGGEPLVRRAVYVAQLHDQRGTSTGFPMIRRYVLAAFAYGDDLVSFEVQTSHDLEVPRAPHARKFRERHDEEFRRLRDEIRDRIDTAGLVSRGVVVLDGYLHHSTGRAS